MINVFIIGCKGIPAQYGGFETFVENLTKCKKDEKIKYYVSCMNNDEKDFVYNEANCFNVKVPFGGSFGRILHVSRALSKVESIVKTNIKQDTNIIYILGCRIGPLMKKHAKRLRKLNCKVFCNPDGLEWKRSKWNFWQKKVLKYCEKCLVKNSDLAICDSKGIEKYINDKYPHIPTTYIAYGAYISKSKCETNLFLEWLDKNNIEKYKYYLVVGRFVPENNLEIIIREFMHSKTTKDLVIITNVENNSFYKQLSKTLNFAKDKRIKFVGTVYDVELLKKIRENAFAYLHGHEVGGTNPSLLEALASTKLNILLDVEFNKEVGMNSALYFNKSIGNLASLIDSLEDENIDFELFDKQSTDRIAIAYSWKKIVSQYEKLFCQMERKE